MFIVGKSFFSENLSKLDIKSRGYLTTPFKSHLSLAQLSPSFFPLSLILNGKVTVSLLQLTVRDWNFGLWNPWRVHHGNIRCNFCSLYKKIIWHPHVQCTLDLKNLNNIVCFCILGSLTKLNHVQQNPLSTILSWINTVEIKGKNKHTCFF